MRISDWSSDVCSSDLQFRKGLDEFQLEAGALAYAPFEEALKPLWVSNDGANREHLMNLVASSVALARAVGSRTIAVLVMAAEGVGTAAQLANVTDNLRQAADLAARGEVTLGIEPRSEENTSELQSLMRNPYAVL